MCARPAIFPTLDTRYHSYHRKIVVLILLQHSSKCRLAFAIGIRAAGRQVWTEPKVPLEVVSASRAKLESPNVGSIKSASIDGMLMKSDPNTTNNHVGLNDR